jgi:flagellar L-ring protein precursor FlgH
MSWRAAVLIGIATAVCAQSGSIYNPSAKNSFLFGDNKATRVGDVLTLIISESATASSKADTKSSKAESTNTDRGKGTGLLKILNQFPEIALNTSQDSKASGSTTRTGSLTARISVTVKAVMPNGNLFVEGTRDVKANSESQKLVFSGIVRPEDVGPSNTVPSYLVADAKAELQGKGTVGDKQRKGIVTRILGWLF